MTFDRDAPWGKWKATGLAALSLNLIDALRPCGVCRKLAFLLRKPVKKGRQTQYDREIWGLKLRLAAKGNLTEQRWLTMAKFHDKPEREALAGFLGPGSVFLDVGANAGFYSFWVLSLNHPGLRVLAVEPTPVMVERMRFNLQTNHLEDRVSLFPCAVTSEPCEVSIEEHSENLGQTGVRTGGGGLKVAGLPLLQLLAKADVTKVDAMKIDIEGLEVPVLESFFANAPNSLWPKMIVGELVGDGGLALEELLRSKGYKLQQKTRMNGIFIHGSHEKIPVAPVSRMAGSRDKILIIKLGALGDIVLAMDAFHAIRQRHPDAHITLLTRAPFTGLAEKMPWFDEVVSDSNPKFLEVQKWMALRSAIRAGGYSRVYDLQGNDRSGFYFKLIGPRRPEWCGAVKGCSHQRPDHRRDPVPAAERLLRFLESVDVPRAGPADLSWFTGPVDALGLPENFVMLIPGCAPRHPYKRWPASHYARLAHLLAEQSLATVAVGTAVDQAAIDEIRIIFPSVISLAGKTDIGQLAEVARRSKGVVGNDTGPIHIAAVTGAPTLVLMSGKTDPARMTPYGPDVSWLRCEDLADLPPEEVIKSIRLR